MVSFEFLVIFLAALRTVLGTKDDLDDPNTCSRNKSLFEIPGDAVLSGKTVGKNLLFNTLTRHSYLERYSTG